MAVTYCQVAISALAETSLATCESIDECVDWADLAEALASYARQRNDETLFHMAQRIKDRAIRRCGEVASQLRPTSPGPKEIGDPGVPDLAPRENARIGAGLSKSQLKQALQVAAVPAPVFEELVERPKPATVTELAERGRKRELREDDPPVGGAIDRGTALPKFPGVEGLIASRQGPRSPSEGRVP